MASNKKNPTVPDIILDEIGLEGLDGITLDGLWIRLAKVLKFQLPLVDKFRIEVWRFILMEHTNLEFYLLPVPRPSLKTFVRADLIDEELGLPIQPEECPFTTYALNPIDINGVRGSCQDYDVRKEILYEDIKNLDLKNIEKLYGHKLIIVGSQQLRERSLIATSIPPKEDFGILTYAMLERIGRSRYNGEISMGKHSILKFISDAKQIFYHKKKLIGLKLIVAQPYSEKLVFTASTGSLFTLTRFFAEFKTRPIFMLETIIEILKAKNNHTIELQQAKNVFPSYYNRYMKRLQKSQVFCTYVETLKLPYRELYPDAPEEEWRLASKNKEKVLVAYKLKNPSLTIDELWCVDEEEEENKTEICDQGNFLIDVPPAEQIYRLIECYGEQGISEAGLQQILPLSRSEARRMYKNLLDSGLITFYTAEFGRTRQKLFVTKKFGLCKKKKQKNIQDTTTSKILEETLANNEDPPRFKEKSLLPGTEYDTQILDHGNEKDSRILEDAYDEIIFKCDSEDPEKMVASTSEVKIEITAPHAVGQLPKCMLSEATFSKKQIERNDSVTTIVNSRQVVDTIEVFRIIVIMEKHLGYKEVLCRKSLRKIVDFLQGKKLLKTLSVSFSCKELLRTNTLLCHPNVQLNDVMFQLWLRKGIRKFVGILADRRYKLAIDICRNPKISGASAEDGIVERQVLNRTKFIAPKMRRIQRFHEILFLLIHENNCDVKIIPPAVAIQTWIEMDPITDYKVLEAELPPIYTTEIHEQMFIKPLPTNQNLPEGWATVDDIVDNMPLSILLQIVCVQVSTYLQSFLDHPIRRHYPSKYLPEELKMQLQNRKSFITPISNHLKTMYYMGLVQIFGYYEKLSLKFDSVYLNKNLLLLDTRSSSKNLYYIDNDKTYPEISLQLEIYEDVGRYWETLHQIALSSNLGCHNGRRSVSAEVSPADKANTRPYCLFKTVRIDEAPSLDRGYIIGDQLGAAGMDATLFCHLRRHWYVGKKFKVQPGPRSVLPKMAVRVKMLKRKESVNSAINKKQLQLSLKRLTRNRVTRMRNFRPEKKKPKSQYDEVDLEALKRMDKLRVSWSSEEDRLLLLCKVALTYLKLTAIRPLVISVLLRDILHWHLKSLNKTSRACQRRMGYMLKFPENVKTVQRWLEDVSKNQYIVQTYGPHFVEDAKKVYKTLDKFVNAMKVIFVEFVHRLTKMFNMNNDEDTEGDRHSSKLLESSEQLEKLFIRQTEAEDWSMYQNPKTIEDIDCLTIDLLVHSSICSAMDKTLYKTQLFEIYKKFDDDTVKKAYKKVRSNQMIIAKRSQFQTKDVIVPTSGQTYHFSAAYSRQFVYSRCLPYEIFPQYLNSLDRLFNVVLDVNSPNQSIDFMSVDSGTTFMIAELVDNPQFVFGIESPKTVLKVDPSHETSTSETSNKIFDHFRDIFASQGTPDYLKQFSETTSEIGRKRIKFNFTFNNFKISYNPFDVVAKLSDSYIHFFCLLRYMNQPVNLKFRKLQDEVCHFELCVLKEQDYLKAIQEVCLKYKSLIEMLATEGNADAKVEADSGETVITINRFNLLTVFETLRKSLELSTVKTQKQDLGKINISLKPLNIIGLANSICSTIENDENAESIERCENVSENDPEFEQTINRDEFSDKVTRFQDCLVVNTPKLCISYSSNDVENMVQYKNKLVPTNMVAVLRKRNDIIDCVLKEAIWPTTTPNVESFDLEMDAQRFTPHEKRYSHEILDFIEKHSVLGASATLLMENFTDENLLLKCIRVLRQNFFIKRLGSATFQYVHRKYLKKWLVETFHIRRLEKEGLDPAIGSKRHPDESCEDEPTVKRPRKMDDEPSTSTGKRHSNPVTPYTDTEICGNKRKSLNLANQKRFFLRPAPWIRINGSINRRVLDKWLGTTLQYCTLNAGQGFPGVCNHFCYLQPVNIFYLLELLRDMGCIRLRVLKKLRLNLFSNDPGFQEEDATEFADFKNVFIKVSPDAFMTFALFLGDRKYNSDFI